MSAHLAESRTSPRIMLDGECAGVTRVSVIWECARTTRRELNGCKSERHHPFFNFLFSFARQLHVGRCGGAREREAGWEKRMDIRCGTPLFSLKGMEHIQPRRRDPSHPSAVVGNDVIPADLVLWPPRRLPLFGRQDSVSPREYKKPRTNTSPRKN